MIDYKNTLHIVYGSRTGNAKAVADLANRYALTLGLNTVFIDMPTIDYNELGKINNLLVCVSTHGEGEPPVQAESFYEYVHQSKDKLKCNYSVLGLGDSSYRYYCQTGVDIDKRLEELGGQRKLELGKCDIDFEDAAKQWVKKAIDIFQIDLKASQRPSDKFIFELDLEDGTENAYKAELLEKRMLTGADSTKKVLHLSLSLKNSNIDYEPGDAIGVFGANSRLFVDELLNELGFDRAFAVKQKDNTRLLKEVLINDYELTLLTPIVIQKYADIINNNTLNELVADNAKLDKYAETNDVLDLVRDFKGDISELQFLSILRKLAQRLYSAASSRSKNNDTVDITVKIIENEDKGRVRNGVCSSFLWHRLDVGDKVPIALETIDKFRLPEDGTKPIIMIGAGTGIAPFRSFLQTRQTQTGKNWLIFGERNKASDFLYQNDLNSFIESGTLTKLSTAFSRDQAEKFYVSDVLKKEGEELQNWLKAGAIIYVCGSKDKLAKSVRHTLKQILAEGGNNSFKALKINNQYLEEVY
ncbi:diflavin oxidoreductase [Carboxylicivirga sp. N1Y90]|uniref:diflavin oxidoreductase n=1 Tax=Carboxylicivirga fragile TaxID=3417571 RepID=UPI003D3343ED|nr:flavodoxin domain-containing protein [Marinilabiliaceae bacterium N1Y90]